MKKDILQAMVRENAFCRAEIEWTHFFDEKNKKPYWILYFVSAYNKEIRYPLETARGPLREFKSLNSAISAFAKITEGRLRDFRIVPEPW